MAVSRWRFEVLDRLGRKLGEVTDATGRRIERVLNGTSTANFTVTSTHPLLEALYQEDHNLIVYEYVNDTDQIRFHGEINLMQATNNDQQGVSVVVTAADPSWRFSKRVSGRSAAPSAIGGNSANVAKQLIDTANSDGETGVRTVATSAGGSVSYPPGPYKLLNECITDLSAAVDTGFDWVITPLEWDGGKFGRFDTASDMRTDQPNAGFEFGPGTRANVKSFDLTTNHVDMANRIYNPPPDLTTGTVLTDSGGTNAALATQSRSDHGVHAVVVESTDISDGGIRQGLVDWHVLLRYNPQQILTFTPIVDPHLDGTVPLFGTDYVLGDRVPVRIAPDGLALIDGFVRIHKMTVEIDSHGRATYTPTTRAE